MAGWGVGPVNFGNPPPYVIDFIGVNKAGGMPCAAAAHNAHHAKTKRNDWVHIHEAMRRSRYLWFSRGAACCDEIANPLKTLMCEWRIRRIM